MARGASYDRMDQGGQGSQSQQKTYRATFQTHGNIRCGAQAEHLQKGQGGIAQGFQVSLAQTESGRAEPCLGNGHHLYPRKGRLPVPVCHYRPLQPLCGRLVALQYNDLGMVQTYIGNRHYGAWCAANNEHTDQGSQFTAKEFHTWVTAPEQDIRPCMDGKGRAIDNIFIERLWRSVKYEHVYLFPANDGLECYRGIREYFDYCNNERRHQGIDGQRPFTVYEQKKKKAA